MAATAAAARLTSLLDAVNASDHECCTTAAHLASRRELVAALDDLEAAVRSEGLLGATVGVKDGISAASVDAECRELTKKLRPQSNGAALAAEQLKRSEV